MAELERRYRWAHDPVARSHWQLIWLLASGMPIAAVVPVTDYWGTWVREVARRNREAGPDGLGDRRHANPGATPLLTPAQQAQWRAALAGPAPDGGIRTCRKVAAWMAAALGWPVAEVRGWEWMRLGFTPQRPRPRETRADPAAQAQIDAVAGTHPDGTVTVEATDEHRLGLLPVVRRV